MLRPVVNIMMTILLMVASGLVISSVIEIPGMEGLVSLGRHAHVSASYCGEGLVSPHH